MCVLRLNLLWLDFFLFPLLLLFLFSVLLGFGVHLTKFRFRTRSVTTRDTLACDTFTNHSRFFFSFERSDLLTEILKRAQNLRKRGLGDGHGLFHFTYFFT